MPWKDIFVGRNPDTGRPYFRRIKIPKVLVVLPPPPPNFEKETPPPQFVPPTFVAMSAQAMEEKEKNIGDE